MTYSINLLLDCINSQVDSFQYSTILAKVQNAIALANKVKTNNLCGSGKVQIDNFVASCYKMLMLRLAYDILEQNIQNSNQSKNLMPSEQRQKLRQIISHTKTALKEYYCQVMQSVTEKKCDTIQLLLFIIYSSTRKVLTQLCEMYEILKYYFIKRIEARNNKDQLETLCCILINYEITGVNIKENVYSSLKNKYLKRHKNQFKKNKKNCQNNNKNLLLNFLNNINQQNNLLCRDEKQKVDDKRYLNEQNRQFFKQIKQIFVSKTYKSQFHQISQPIKQKYSSLRKSQSSHLNKNGQIFTNLDKDKIFYLGNATARNSSAFQENRRNCYFSTRKSGIIQNLKFSKKSRITPTKNNKQQSSNLGLSLISASLRFLFAKNQKKPLVKQVQKPSLTSWRNKIGKMYHENIQRAKINDINQKWKKNTKKTQQDGQKQNQNIQYHNLILNNNSTLTNLRKQRYLYADNEVQGNNFLSQHKNIGYVMKMDYNSQNISPKHKKTSSKQFKQQYKQFSKKMQENYCNYFDQRNFNVRLQKVLTGNYKI